MIDFRIGFIKLIVPKRSAENCQKGFTLAETLMALLIVLMVSSIVATGIPAARNAYEKITVAANAQVLLSTTVTTLREELGTAREATVSDDGSEISYYSARTDGRSRIYKGEDGVIMIEEYIGFQESAEGGAGGGEDQSPEGISRQLISKQTATADLYVTYDAISKDGQMITIKGLWVKRLSDAAAAPTDVMDLVIRSVVRD